MSATATLVPTSTVHNDGTLYFEATAHACLDDSNGDTSYVQFGADGYVSCGMSDMPSALGVDSVIVSCSYKFGGVAGSQKLRLFVVSGGTTYYGSYQNAVTASYTTLTSTWTLDPNTSTAWTPAKVNASGAGVEYSDSSLELIRISYLASTVSYAPLPASVQVARSIATFGLHTKKQPQRFVTFSGNLDLLNVPLLGAIDMEHVAGHHPVDAGWGSATWERNPFEQHSYTVDFMAGTVTSKLKDHRDLRALVWYPAYSSKASGSLEDGIARLHTPGSTFTFTRASEQTITNPVSESETVPVDIPAYTSQGLALLSAAGGLVGSRAVFSNDTGERTWPAAQGTAMCDVYLAAVSGSADQVVFYTYHDASNWAKVYWDGAGAQWVFEIRAGGVTYQATKATTPSATTWYQIGARWTGYEGELDATAFTASIWIDGVKGTDVVVGSAMTESASSTFDIGSLALAGTEALNGYIRNIRVVPLVLTDVEMARDL